MTTSLPAAGQEDRAGTRACTGKNQQDDHKDDDGVPVAASWVRWIVSHGGLLERMDYSVDCSIVLRAKIDKRILLITVKWSIKGIKFRSNQRTQGGGSWKSDVGYG